MKKLYLLRHAESDYSMKLDDKKRTLNDIGIANSLLMGRHFQEKNISPEIIVSSDAVRTTQTIKNVVSESAITTKINFNPKLYLATAGEILKIIAKISDDYNELLLVAHNPGIEVLVKLIIKENFLSQINELYSAYPPCGLTTLDIKADSWKDINLHSCELLDFISPISLR